MMVYLQLMLCQDTKAAPWINATLTWLAVVASTAAAAMWLNTPALMQLGG